jgi:hypothetical protein
MLLSTWTRPASARTALLTTCLIANARTQSGGKAAALAQTAELALSLSFRSTSAMSTQRNKSSPGRVAAKLEPARAAPATTSPKFPAAQGKKMKKNRKAPSSVNRWSATR